MPHSPRPSGYFSPGLIAKQMRHAEEAVTDSPLLTPSGGLCSEQHWVTGSPKLPVHRTVYPGERRPEVRPEELKEALQTEVHAQSKRKGSTREQVSVKDFAYNEKSASEALAIIQSLEAHPAADTLDKAVSAQELKSTHPLAETGHSHHPHPQPSSSSPTRAVGARRDSPACQTPSPRKGHRRSPAKDLRMNQHGVMMEV